jgi:thiosulfate/3-mercaptopyruvate sulfurtransferase
VSDEITAEELAGRLDDPALVVIDVRTVAEFAGNAGYPCDPRQGHLPGARHLDVAALAGCATVEDVRALVGLPDGAEVVAYCHSGSRSAMAVSVLRASGYDARNYVGSWHEWSADPALPVAS